MTFQNIGVCDIILSLDLEESDIYSTSNLLTERELTAQRWI